MTSRIAAAAVVGIILLWGLALGEAFAQSIRSAKKDIAGLRYDAAETKLVDIAKSTGGPEKQEALFLLAGLKSSVSEVEIIYQEVVRLDPSNSWAEKAQLELAKIRYAVGNYKRALTILSDSEACEHFDEACYFQGLSAAMVNDYSDARLAFSRVRRGKYRSWAFLSLAEIEMATENPDEACRKYRSMAQTSISPTAMYRYAECLEKKGDTEEAMVVFTAVIRNFASTPEALLAEQKLELLRAPPPEVSEEPAGLQPAPPPTSGFTIQFGSFHDRENAIKLASQIKRKLPGVRIDTDVIGNKEIHRVRYGYFGSRGDAQSRASEITSQLNEPCTIMTLP